MNYTPYNEDLRDLNEANRPMQKLAVLRAYKDLLKTDPRNSSHYFLTVVQLYFNKDEIENINWMMQNIK